MIVIRGDAQSGKTMLLMRLAQYNDKKCAFVCADEQRARSVRTWVKVLGLEVENVLTVQDLVDNKTADHQFESIYVDDGMACLRAILGDAIKAVTFEDGPDNVEVVRMKNGMGVGHEENKEDR